MRPLDPHSLRRALSAFADGELDTAAAENLRRHLAADPSTADELRRLRELSIAARRAVHTGTPPPSADLRARLRALSAAGSPPTTAVPTAPAPSLPAAARPMRVWSVAIPRAAAAAVLLAAGIWVGRQSARPPAPSPQVAVGPDQTDADVLPAAVVAQAEEIHGVCSRLADGLHAGGYPADVAALAPAVERDLRGDRPYPDLTPIGYRYRGAGPCGRPLVGTAHLLYRADRPDSVGAVSVFVQPWRGQYPLAAGRLYTVSVARTPFPMLAWRTDGVVYFLLADDAGTLDRAVNLIRGTPSTRP